MYKQRVLRESPVSCGLTQFRNGKRYGENSKDKLAYCPSKDTCVSAKSCASDCSEQESQAIGVGGEIQLEDLEAGKKRTIGSSRRYKVCAPARYDEESKKKQKSAREQKLTEIAAK